MTDARTPRVNKALMANYKGQTVRVVAKLITVRIGLFRTRAPWLTIHSCQLADGRAIVETSDGGEVEVSLPRVRRLMIMQHILRVSPLKTTERGP